MMAQRILTQHWYKPGYNTLEGYKAEGGFKSLERVLAMKPDEVIEEVKNSNLRGRGGAGFPTGMKWSFVPKDTPKPKYLASTPTSPSPAPSRTATSSSTIPTCCWRASPSPPGRSACTPPTSTSAASSYPRPSSGEGRSPRRTRPGIFGKSMLGSGLRARLSTSYRGAGAYICGEETGAARSPRGQEGLAPAQASVPRGGGPLRRPHGGEQRRDHGTLPAIFEKGAEWYAKLGTEKSGRHPAGLPLRPVNRPGVYEIPMGPPSTSSSTTSSAAGACPAGRKVKAVIPGGSSAPVLARRRAGRRRSSSRPSRPCRTWPARAASS